MSSGNSTCSLSKKEKRTKFQRLIALILNPWFWYKVWMRILEILFGYKKSMLRMYAPPPEAALLSLDGSKRLSLLKDIVANTLPDMPLILNMGSYN
jgi:hypothetical protein